jgi:hypothetical protein
MNFSTRVLILATGISILSLSWLAAKLATPPNYGFLHGARENLSIVCAHGACTSTRTFEVDANYSDVVKEAVSELGDQWIRTHGSAHIGEVIFTRDLESIRISFWYKPTDSEASAEEPPLVEITTDTTWLDHLKVRI